MMTACLPTMKAKLHPESAVKNNTAAKLYKRQDLIKSLIYVCPFFFASYCGISGGRFCRLRGDFEMQAAAVKQFGFLSCFGRLGVPDLAVV